MPPNWRTTLAGLAAALGTAAQLVDDPQLRTIGLLVSVVALTVLGFLARDTCVLLPLPPPPPPPPPPSVPAHPPDPSKETPDA
jgi:hypothetical protein